MEQGRAHTVTGAKDEMRPRRVRRTKAEQRASAVEDILDAAEPLFARHGLYGVTLKDIAVRADMNTSLLHYYFEDKKAIFDAVFARRATTSNALRMAALERYEAECGDAPSVEGALHAYLDTDLDLYINGGDGWRNWGTLGAQVAMTPEWGAELFDAHFDPLVLKLIGLLKRALPHCPDETIFWGYHFVTGALVQTLARTGRIDKLSGGLCRSDDFEAIKPHLARFMAAGFERICGADQAKG